jgi:phosphate-selective porin OprO/OprP
MWDKGTEEWNFRQTGLMVGVPEISSEFFIGRTKEGYSQYKVMTGYDLWTIERSPFLDAFVPILGDGIKWMGSVDHHRVIWNAGYYFDALSEQQKFATFDHQFVGRLVYLPILEGSGDLLHVGVMGRWGKPDENVFQAKSKPESYLAPNFVDTGKFPTDNGKTYGVEAWYRKKSVLVGGEWGWQTFDAPTGGRPKFHGETSTWTGSLPGRRGATTRRAATSRPFHRLAPVFEGGPWAVEASLNYSYIDLDGGTLQGGKFWRLGPALKWHLMDYLRIELAYGYGKLDRFGLEGVTQFFQARFLTAL